MGKSLVMKFGGTSVGTADAMQQVIDIIHSQQSDWDRLVVVTSALSGVTDQLIDSARRAAEGDLSRCAQVQRELENRHLDLAAQWLQGPALAAARAEIGQRLTEFSELCQAVSVLGEATARTLDAAASLGERLSAPLLAAAAAAQGIPAVMVDAAELIVTDEQFQNAQPDVRATTQHIQARLIPLLDEGKIPVVTGFLGATPRGQVTTLGRGGSDYTASILGVALQADEVWIWTDVDGVMSADPRWVPEARTLPVLSYREVAELAHYGAKVLQPRSIYPVIQAGIPVRVCNTFNPAHPGTRLVSEQAGNGHGAIKSIAVLRNQYLVVVSGRGMIGVPGIAARTFSAVASTGVSIPMIIQSSSEQSICFAVPSEAAERVLQALRRNFAREIERQDVERIETSAAVDVITLLCPQIRTTPGVTGKIFGCLSEQGVNVLAISFGASDISINLVIDSQDTRTALTALHQLTLLEAVHA